MFIQYKLKMYSHYLLMKRKECVDGDLLTMVTYTVWWSSTPSVHNKSLSLNLHFTTQQVLNRSQLLHDNAKRKEMQIDSTVVSGIWPCGLRDMRDDHCS